MLRRAIRHGIPGIVGLLLLGAIAPADAAPKVRIVAYINVTSGCQEETVNRLKAFQAKHGKDVHLEIIDFGSEACYTRWRADGFHCQEILINGSDQFRIGSGPAARVVAFRMPEGVRWTFADLDAVLAQELKAPGSSALTEEKARELAQRVPISSRQGKWKSQAVGEVVVGAQVVFRYRSALNGKSPLKRAQESAIALKRLYADGLSSDEIRVRRGSVGGAPVGVILARGESIAQVSKAEADIIKRAPAAAAQTWALNLREALRTLGR
jgi:hypothetical protein